MMITLRTLMQITATFCCLILCWARAAQAEPEITANGVRCDNASASANTFSFTELSPSILSANTTRLEKVRRMNAFAAQVSAICAKQGLPGCAGVKAWQVRRAQPWPSEPDVDYLRKRAALLDGDDDMLAESTRVLAHWECQNQRSPSPECEALVAAEEAAAPDVKTRIADMFECAPDAQQRGAQANDSSKSRASVFYSSYAFWSRADARSVCVRRKEPDERAKAAAASFSNASNADGLRAAAVAARAALLKADQAYVKVSQLKAATPPNPVAIDAAQKTLNLLSSDAKKKADTVSALQQALLTQFMVQGATAYEAEKLHRIPPESERYAWLPANSSIGRAAADALSSQPLAGRASPPRIQSEEAALLRNQVACQNATIYVSPTRELVRHALDNTVGNRITVCVDTAGFATVQPIQLKVTTPAAQRVYGLWPGEPTLVPLETSFDEAQVAHLTISGYPRREVLRAIARNVGGPLNGQNGQDAFDLLALAGRGADSGDSSSTIASLSKLLSQMTKDAKLAKSLLDLSNEVAKDARATLPSKIDEAFDNLNGVVRNHPAYADPRAKKMLDALLPALPEPDNGKPRKASALARSQNELLNIANAVTGFSASLAAKVADLKAASQSSADGQEQLGKSARIMCALATEVLPLVVEDVLVRGCAREGCTGHASEPYVLQYDFSGGFQRTSVPRPIKDGDKIFVAVQGVKPGWSIGAAIDNRSVVQRNIALVGLSQTDTSQFNFASRSSQSVSGFNSLRPLDLDVQAPSTQIIALGELSGSARYTFQVCASNSPTDDCTAAVASGAVTVPGSSVPLAHRTIATNTLVVHSYRHLGVRAGFGMSQAFSTESYKELVPVSGGMGSGVQRAGNVTEFGVPLLLTYYCGKGRDAIDMPKGVQFGGAGGLDLLHPFSNPRVYLGGVVDFWGLGLTVAASYGSVASVGNDVDTVVTPEQVQKKTVWLPGIFIGLTTDLDIFQAAFSKYFVGTPFPTINPTSDGK